MGGGKIIINKINPVQAQGVSEGFCIVYSDFTLLHDLFQVSLGSDSVSLKLIGFSAFHLSLWKRGRL